MFLSKVKVAAIVLLALGLVGSGAGFIAHRTGAEQPTPQSALVPGLPAAVADKATKKDAEAQPDPPPPAVVEEKPASRNRELYHLLDQPVRFAGWQDPKSTLNEALEVLAQRYNLSFDINEHAFKEADIKEVGKFEIASPDPIPAMHTRLGTVLQKVLSRVSPSATYIIRDDFIEITTVQAIRKEFFADRPNGPFPPLVTAHFDKVPLEAALKDLGRSNNVVLDIRANKEGQAPVTADLTNVPLDTAVRMLADMSNLRVVRLDNVFYVTTPENAKRLHEEQVKLNAEHPGEEEPEKKPAPTEPAPALVAPAVVADKAKEKEPEAKPKPKSDNLFVDPQMDMASRLKAWRDKLNQRVDFPGYDNPKMTLNEALDDLSNRYGLVFKLNEEAFKVEDITDVGKTEIASPHPIPPMKARLATVLQTILARVKGSSGAKYLFRKDHVEITTSVFVWTEMGEPENSLDGINAEFTRGLIIRPERSPMWDAFEDTPVAQILQRIADDYGLNVVMDPGVAKNLQIKATVQFNNVAVGTAVRLLVNMADVSIIRVDNVFYVTTEEKAERLRKEQRWDPMVGWPLPMQPAPEKPAK